MNVTIYNATPDDADTFLSLWVEFLKEHEKLGSDTAATLRSLAFYEKLFAAYTYGDEPGVALLARVGGDPAGALLWGSAGHIPLDRTEPNTVHGWGSYTAPGFRRQGVTRALRDEATVQLYAMGVRHCVGTAVLSNVPGVEASRRAGFVPTMLLGTLDLAEKAREVKMRRAFGSTGSPLTDGFYWEGMCPLCGSNSNHEGKET